MLRCYRPVIWLAVVASLLPAHVQRQASAGTVVRDDAEIIDELVVRAEAIRGGVDAPQPPVLEFDEGDIVSYGAGSLEALLIALEAETSSSRGRGGRPAFLVNGVRISSFRELRSYPPEALLRVEVFSEEVAQRYGFPPDQRVINFVLKEQFASREIELEYGRPAKGGFAERELELTYLRIEGLARFNLSGEVGDASMLTESERNVALAADDLPDVVGDPDPRQFRSLVPASDEYELTANFSRALGAAGGGLSLNATVERENELRLGGLDTVLLEAPDGTSARRSVGDPLARRVRSDRLSLGATLNTDAGAWQITGTADGSRERRRSRVDRNVDSGALLAAARLGDLAIDGPLPPLGDGGADVVHSDVDELRVLLTAVSGGFLLPAGESLLTLDLGFDWTRIEGRDTRNPGFATELERRESSAGLNLSLPVASRDQGVLPWLGDLTVNGNGGANRLSDFGTLTDWSVGLNWAPADALNLQLTYIAREMAPALAELGEPEVVELNVPTFDFATGDTVFTRRITGGNPGLSAQRQRDWRFALQWELPGFERARLLFEYNRNRSEDVSSAFPLLTPAIESAFPERVTRGGDGRLVAVDQRPITLAEQDSSRIRYGLDVRGRIGEADGRRRRGGPGGDGEGRWNLSVSHTVEIDNDVRIGRDGPSLDLLGGDALAGGVSRHAVNFEGGIYHRGLGVRVRGRHESDYRINGTGLPGSVDLDFGALTTFDLRFFADLGSAEALLKRSPLFANTRLSLSIDNVFDDRRRVRDGNGDVPLRYQPFRIDPVGRFVEIELRKLF